MDPETLLPCPYDKSHQVRAARLPYHLVKCERNNPQVARAMATCPFNARHRVPRAELQSHVASCPDKCDHSFPHGTGASLGDRVKQPDVPRACQKPPCQEDWEAEVEDLEEPPPFILNVETPHLLLLRNRSVPAAPTNQNRDEGGSGHLLQAQEGGNRGARGSSAPLAAAAPAERRFTHRF